MASKAAAMAMRIVDRHVTTRPRSRGSLSSVCLHARPCDSGLIRSNQDPETQGPAERAGRCPGEPRNIAGPSNRDFPENLIRRKPRSGRCLPSYDAICEAAGCCRASRSRIPRDGGPAWRRQSIGEGALARRGLARVAGLGDADEQLLRLRDRSFGVKPRPAS
jgi:hypothetical protein